MSTKGDVQVRIGGDLSGQVVIGNHNIQIGNVNGGIVNLVTPTDQPEYSRRSAPVNLRPRSLQSFFDREEEIVVLRSAVNGSVPISVYGEEGIGKSTLVSRFCQFARCRYPA